MALTSVNIRLMLLRLTQLRSTTSFLTQPTSQLTLILFFLAPQLRKLNGPKRKLLQPLLVFQSQTLGVNPASLTQIQLMMIQLPLTPPPLKRTLPLRLPLTEPL